MSLRHGHHEAWMLLCGDKLPEGAVVLDCTAEHSPPGMVLVTLQRSDKSLAEITLPRDMVVEVNKA
jgi:hypothetical protein